MYSRGYCGMEATAWIKLDVGGYEPMDVGTPEQKEKRDLLEELMLLPENAVVRRINELVKRARSVKVHAYIIHYLRKQMPYVMGKQDKQVRQSLLLRELLYSIGKLVTNEGTIEMMAC